MLALFFWEGRGRELSFYECQYIFIYLYIYFLGLTDAEGKESTGVV